MSSCGSCHLRSTSSECIPIRKTPPAAIAIADRHSNVKTASTANRCDRSPFAHSPDRLQDVGPLSAALVPASLQSQALPAATMGSAASAYSVMPSGPWQPPQQPAQPIAMAGMAHGAVPNFHPSLARDGTQTVRSWLGPEEWVVQTWMQCEADQRKWRELRAQAVWGMASNRPRPMCACERECVRACVRVRARASVCVLCVCTRWCVHVQGVGICSCRRFSVSS
jgi:hypothetical protein